MHSSRMRKPEVLFFAAAAGQNYGNWFCRFCSVKSRKVREHETRSRVEWDYIRSEMLVLPFTVHLTARNYCAMCQKENDISPIEHQMLIGFEGICRFAVICFQLFKLLSWKQISLSSTNVLMLFTNPTRNHFTKNFSIEWILDALERSRRRREKERKSNQIS